MKRNESRIFREVFAFALAFAFVSMFSACSDDKVAGGSSDDAGVYAVKDLDVAGVSQKGPFVKGSVVTVQGIDCKTMELTGEIFEGTVKSDKGDFGVDDVNLSATCALFEVTGYYFNEVTGKKSANEVTLHALSDLSDRKHVNINMLTELEYKRVMNLVSEEKMSFADAKKQAEKEVLASFNVNGDYALSEDLNIFENGDGNAALLAVSVLVQVSGDSSKNVDVAERVDNFGTTIAENGALGDSAKTEMADWATTAESNGQMAKIRRNLENLGYAEEIASFENVVEEFATGVASSESSSSVALGAGTSSSSSSSEVKQSSSSSSVILSSSEESSNNTKDSYLNPKIEYGELTDTRDGQVYKTVKIGNQVWMAENLNYADSVKTPSLKGKSWCYDNKLDNCSKYGRLYMWSAAIDSVALYDGGNGVHCGYGKTCALPVKVRGVCPSGWHLPDTTEWNTLFDEVGGKWVAGKVLKSQTGWNSNGNGTDAVGFAALPAGRWYDGNYFSYGGSIAYFWSASQKADDNSYFYYLDEFDNSVSQYNLDKYNGMSIRCVKDDEIVVSSSSAAVESSSSVNGFDWSLPKESYLNPDVNYGEMTDSRDGKIYKTVKIGDQTWMAENLNYAYLQSTENMDSTSFCYDNDPANCDKYGRLYIWAAAMDSAGLLSDDAKGCGYDVDCSPKFPVQGVCPSGWHLPNQAEWLTLYSTVGSKSLALEALKSQNGWCNNSNGTDAFGFSGLPAGYGYEGSYGSFKNNGCYAVFWTSTGNNRWYANYEELYYEKEYLSSGEKLYSFSIRCVKN